MPRLSVGQKLWFVPSARWNGRPTEIEITRVGRSYAYFGSPHNERRIDIQTMEETGKETGTVYGHAYLNKEYYEAQKRRDEVFEILRRRVHDSWCPAPGVTEADIRAAAALLKMDLPTPTPPGGELKRKLKQALDDATPERGAIVDIEA